MHSEMNPEQVNLLSSSVAVEALAPALGSVVKRAAMFVRAAGVAQALPRPAGTPELAAHCFAAAVPALADCLLETAGAELSSSVQDLQQQPTEVHAGSSSGSSTGSIQQSMQSIALLTVLLARSLVVLSNAQEAAAAAADTTPAQLFAR
jgi:hypothetical protein